jgi:hypothetical protein
MLSKLKQMFSRGGRSSKFEPQVDDDAHLRWLDPPTDPRNSAAWDRYWTEQVMHGFGPAVFDLFCHDHDLVKVMHNEGMKTVLCAGCGISQEPRGLCSTL